jgi:hypothetical protein
VGSLIKATEEAEEAMAEAEVATINHAGIFTLPKAVVMVKTVDFSIHNKHKVMHQCSQTKPT